MKYKIKISFLFLMIFTLFLFESSCKRCWLQGKTYHEPLHQIFIDYFAPGKDGSYWVYQDSATLEIDTLRLTNYNRKYVELYGGGCEYEDKIWYYMEFNNMSVKEISVELSRRDNISYGGYRLSNNGLSFSYDNDFGYSRYDEKEPEYFDSLTVNEYVYYDVLKYDDSDIIYFAANVGIIKWIINGKTLNLINYEIQN